jgi:hypothetical protein
MSVLSKISVLLIIIPEKNQECDNWLFGSSD